MQARIHLVRLPIAHLKATDKRFSYLRYVTEGSLIVYRSMQDNTSHLGQVVFIRFNGFTHNIINCRVRRVAVPTGEVIEEAIKQEHIERIVATVTR
jgi:hypothetical protein